jgi:phosphoenolpyruvate carboxykinase (ATP)
VKHGAILENIMFVEGTRTPDYANAAITQNTRVSYPLHFIPSALPGSMAGHPENIFFLTADAFGTLPPISKLTPGQAMYHFISGYTAKVAGTEEGVKEPQATFSACFGAPFLPLHPTQYADMLGEKMRRHKVNVWLVNTGWTGGGYGVGSRIKLQYTRAMISAALNGALDDVEYRDHPVFGLNMPVHCPGVPDEILDPANTWESREAYDVQANMLAESFVRNFERFGDKASPEILAAAPLVSQSQH